MKNDMPKKPRLTKEEREAKKLKLQEERAAKKAARLAKREAKKQKEAEKRAAAKAKREERKAKKAARLLKEKERKEARKRLRAEKRAARLAAREAKKLEKKRARTEKKDLAKKKPEAAEAKTLTPQEKLEAERNEWKALSAIRRYVKDNAKILASLPEEKRAKRIKKLEKMGYTVGIGENGIPESIGYSFTADVKCPHAKISEKKAADEKTVEPEVLPVEDEKVTEEEELLSDAEIIEAAEQDKEEASVEVLAGDTFKDETETSADDSLSISEDDDFDDDEEEDEADDEDDIFGRSDDDVSSEQLEYRRDAFRELEGNGAWD